MTIRPLNRDLAIRALHKDMAIEMLNGDRAVKIRKHIVFYGWVQGVGFRWRASRAAALYGATGWVRNDYDGTVTMEIQGSEEQIDQVILAIERGKYVRIENMEVRTLPPDPDERDFRVR